MAHFEDSLEETNLSVNKGVETPPIINPYLKKNKKRVLTVDDLYNGIIAKDLISLSRGITLVESANPTDIKMAQELVNKCLDYNNNNNVKSIRIGITGIPGAGKSTFIEAVGNYITTEGNRVAVLAVDPSSSTSKGSILGDKTRMESLCQNENVFIRPSPSAGSLGGVAQKTMETIVLCESAGYNVILIETVGVGQSEITVHSMVDMFMLLQIAGAGDELQGIKRGIMEMADAIVITKAEGENKQRAEIAKSVINNALHLFSLPKSKWSAKTIACSAVTGENIENVWKLVLEYIKHIKKNKHFTEHRRLQAKQWLHKLLEERLLSDFYQNDTIAEKIKEVEVKAMDFKATTFSLVEGLMDMYKNMKK